MREIILKKRRNRYFLYYEEKNLVRIWSRYLLDSNVQMWFHSLQTKEDLRKLKYFKNKKSAVADAMEKLEAIGSEEDLLRESIDILQNLSVESVTEVEYERIQSVIKRFETLVSLNAEIIDPWAKEQGGD